MSKNISANLDLRATNLRRDTLYSKHFSLWTLEPIPVSILSRFTLVAGRRKANATQKPTEEAFMENGSNLNYSPSTRWMRKEKR
jgi:hypothetical protein